MARRGRPTKFTENRGEAIIQVMRVGTYLDDAAAYAGISLSTLRNWLRAGQQARELLDTGTRITKEQKALADFHVGFEKATTTWQIEALSKLTQSDDVRALTWRLERRFPTKWGNKQQITIEDNGHEDRIRTQIAVSLAVGQEPPLPRKAWSELSEEEHQDDPIRSLYGSCDVAA
jgi:transposase